MPTATLLTLTSPLLLGQSPIGSAPLPMAAAVPAHSFRREGDPVAVMDVNWSLVDAHQDGEGQSGQSGQGEDQQEPEPSEENTIVVEGTVGPTEGDPVEAMNEQTFRIMQDVDQALVAPLAYAYEDGLPSTVRTGLRNVIRNLGEPVNAINFLLQLKIGKAFETAGRFLINSTLGFGGLIDLAEKPGIGLPYRRNGLANTLGYYGVGPGPYLVVPLAGSTTVRDVIGSTVDNSFLPFVVGGPFNQPEVGIPVFVVSQLQARLEIDEKLERINASVDPYATQRDGYLAEREAEIEEFRSGSPLQGIPDGARTEEQRNDRVYDEDIDYSDDELDSASPQTETVSFRFKRPVTAQFDPGMIAITQHRASSDRRYMR